MTLVLYSLGCDPCARPWQAWPDLPPPDSTTPTPHPCNIRGFSLMQQPESLSEIRLMHHNNRSSRGLGHRYTNHDYMMVSRIIKKRTGHPLSLHGVSLVKPSSLDFKTRNVTIRRQSTTYARFELRAGKWVRKCDNFLVTVEKNPGPPKPDTSSSLNSVLCRVCNKEVPKPIIDHLKKAHPRDGKGGGGKSKADSSRGDKKSKLINESKADAADKEAAAKDSKKQRMDELKAEIADLKAMVAQLKDPNNLKQRIDEIKTQIEFVKIKREVEILLESQDPVNFPKPPITPRPPTSIYRHGILGLPKLRPLDGPIEGKIVIGNLKRVGIGFFTPFIIFMMLLVSLSTIIYGNVVIKTALALAQVHPEHDFCLALHLSDAVELFGFVQVGFLFSVLLKVITFVLELFLDSTFRMNLGICFNAYDVSHLLFNLWALFYTIVTLYWIWGLRLSVKEIRLVAIPSDRATPILRDDRPLFDRSEKRMHEQTFRHYTLYVEMTTSRETYYFREWDLPTIWKKTYGQKLKKNILLSPEMIPIMINRRTLMAKRDDPALALEAAVRLASSCPNYQEDYNALLTDGRSMYRDMALVMGAIVCKDVYHNNLHF